MRKWDQSTKSQKTVGSMIIDPNKKQADTQSSQTKATKGKGANQAPLTNGKAESAGKTGSLLATNIVLYSLDQL